MGDASETPVGRVRQFVLGRTLGHDQRRPRASGFEMHQWLSRV